jgi:DNA-binding NarL/FixJ family response regulator
VLVDAADDMRVVGEAANGAEAVDLVTRFHPDVVLMDIRMPVTDGIEATRQIVATAEGAATKVLILTTFDLDEYVYGALRAGASGFLLKDTRPEDLLAAIRTLADGDALLAPSVTRRLISEFVQRPDGSPSPVLVEVGRGLSNADIAARLNISAATAKTHVSRVLMKLHAHDRAQLVIVAYESHLITPA